MANETWTPRLASRAAHPDRFHVIGKLFGLEPAPVHSSRVLEIGCRDGGHLLGLASAYPGAEFVGVDRLAGALEAGSAVAERARLSNVSFRPFDAIESLSGPFDYVIADCSSLSAHAAHAILAEVGRLLSDGGIAFVEHRCRPGALLDEAVLGMLRRHVRHVDSRISRIGQARALVRALLDAPAGGRGVELLAPEVERVGKLSDSELGAALDDEGEALLFSEFLRRIESHGLAFVSEATLGDGSVQRFQGKPRELLERFESRLVREQYVDFLSGRRRRQSLVCRTGASLPALSPERALGLYAMSPLVVVGEPAERRVRAPGGAEVRMDDRIQYDIVRSCGAEWPRATACSALLVRATRDTAVGERAFAAALVAAAERELVELRSHPVSTAVGIPERPFVAPLARIESELGRPITSSLHFPVVVRSPLGRELLKLLDGTISLEDLQKRFASASTSRGVAEAIATELRTFSRAGLLQEPPNGEPGK